MKRVDFSCRWRVTIGALISSLLTTYLLFIAALLSDRGKEELPVDPEPLPHRPLTNSLELKETFFHLLPSGREWRLSDSLAVQLQPHRFKRSLLESTAQLDHFDCDQILSLVPKMNFFASGWTKAVYSATDTQGRKVAVKMVDTMGHDMDMCVTQRKLASPQECYQRAAGKIVKEIALLTHMRHPNVVRVLGYCIPNVEFNGKPSGAIAIVTEFGEPGDLLKLLQLSWEDRLKVALGMSRLLAFLSNSPWGSVVMNDFRRQQFVLVNGEIKLSDVDDIGLEEPVCRDTADCLTHLPDLFNLTTPTSLSCVAGLCEGVNEVRNVFNAARHFISILLPYGYPPPLKGRIDSLVAAYNNISLPTKELYSLTQEIVNLYSTGGYADAKLDISTQSRFVKLPGSDLTGRYDYTCSQSASHQSCVLSVAHTAEAIQICAAHDLCRAFVWTNVKTWTGRTLVHFKSNYSTPNSNPNTTLYLKVR